MMQRERFFWQAHPLQGLAEAWLGGILILGSLFRLVGYVVPLVFSSGTLFLCGACGMWAVLRIRVPQGPPRRQAIWECLFGVALSLLMVVGLYLPARSLGWQAIWDQINWDPLAVVAVFSCTGLGYVAARAGVRFWLIWNRLRQRRLLWSLTHAHLLVVVLVAGLAALSVFLIAPYTGVAALLREKTYNPVASVVTQALLIFFPAFTLIVVAATAAIALLLPPSAVFSFFVARRTTRRLEELATATGALRAGNYSARVAVEGEDEVAQLQSDFNAMAETMEHTLRDLARERDTVARLLQARRELIASVSHELRTPVATVRATLDSALARRAEILPATLRRDLEIAESEVTRLQGLFDDLFTLARAEVDGLTLNCRPTDIQPIVQRMAQAIAPLAWQTGRVEVVADVPKGMPLARVDEERLEQVLINLLRNGARHTPPGGIVAVVVAAEDDCVRIEVRDTGEGISLEELPHIWERFYRGENALTRERDGAGLGLAIVKELTEAMGGTVGVESEPGKGSCFTVRLPKA